MTGSERSPRAALALVVGVTVVLSVVLSLVHLPSAVLFAALIGGMAHALTSPTPLELPSGLLPGRPGDHRRGHRRGREPARAGAHRPRRGADRPGHRGHTRSSRSGRRAAALAAGRRVAGDGCVRADRGRRVRSGGGGPRPRCGRPRGDGGAVPAGPGRADDNAAGDRDRLPALARARRAGVVGRGAGCDDLVFVAVSLVVGLALARLRAVLDRLAPRAARGGRAAGAGRLARRGPGAGGRCSGWPSP